MTKLDIPGTNKLTNVTVFTQDRVPQEHTDVWNIEQDGAFLIVSLTGDRAVYYPLSRLTLVTVHPPTE